ncbi:hypothetical protein TSAR_006755 [Trichomalopsis sarcophagae]|uniref:Uncharacterized protein n=1 Tax=Trichomalopsis sarcophagae TaxID=543379 RepID=A0A232EUG3_9HYME|nr:hypothetical protein TSAR_006755 [Trichomalopsis sarcophagae]
MNEVQSRSISATETPRPNRGITTRVLRSRAKEFGVSLNTEQSDDKDEVDMTDPAGENGAGGGFGDGSGGTGNNNSAGGAGDSSGNAETGDANLAEIRHVAIRTPPFWKHCPDACLDQETVQDMLDVMRTPPETGKYPYMKARILESYGFTAQKRLQTLFTGLELGTRKLSQLLRHMRTLAGGSIDDEALRVRWLDLMPDNVAKMLRILRNSPLNELVEVADGIVETGPATFAVHPDNRRASLPDRAITSVPVAAHEPRSYDTFEKKWFVGDRNCSA